MLQERMRRAWGDAVRHATRHYGLASFASAALAWCLASVLGEQTSGSALAWACAAFVGPFIVFLLHEWHRHGEWIYARDAIERLKAGGSWNAGDPLLTESIVYDLWEACLKGEIAALGVREDGWWHRAIPPSDWENCTLDSLDIQTENGTPGRTRRTTYGRYVAYERVLLKRRDLEGYFPHWQRVPGWKR